MVNPVHTHHSLGSSPTPDPYNLEQTWNTALVVAQAAEERKADDILVLQVSEVCYLADYFIVMTGFSSVQVRAISQAIYHAVEEKLNRVPVSVEGQKEGSWILIDYGDVVVHIMLPEEREFYNLEAFWNHAERMNWSVA
ncbi:MAG: ribosome silencing factor [Oscillatoriales cyanobacterium RM2_1_1]|nr:ribosome silencing factor [Oscillatoriales cyanobacterium SM2_3_0]NJO45407.1 ribosome silencing factor [Oscillatoriales cyanobacterium RM2_1_1]